MLFLIHNEDKPGALQIRIDTRAAHLEYTSGFAVHVGGPLLNESGDMCGSGIILEAEDLAAAHAFAENDPYNKAGLFERVSVTEFSKAIWPVAD